MTDDADPRPQRPGTSRIRWRRLDVPGRETAHIERSTDRWLLAGDVRVREGGVLAQLRYQIECDLGWRTRSAIIEGEVGDCPVRFALFADGAGHWTRDGQPLSELSGALDVDLGFTPATNTLPIRRLELAVGQRAQVRSAWLRFPELRLEPLDQTYTREAEFVYQYVTRIDGELFAARLETDAFGRVLRYEDLWQVEFAAVDSKRAGADQSSSGSAGR